MRICAVPRVTSPPALDGDLSEWSGFTVDALDRDSASTIHGPPPERADLMGTLQWAWNGAGLYLAVHVRDDALVHDSPDLAQDDVFELAIDGDGDNAGGGPADHLYRITHDGRQSDRGATIDALRVATRTVPTGWNLEIFIPADHLNLSPDGLESGRPIRFNWAVGDDDDGGGSDARLIAFGTQLDPPEGAWPTATLRQETRTFAGLVESGRWEWAGGGGFNDVFFLDDAYGWAVGPGVWRTTDGGSTWRRVGFWPGRPCSGSSSPTGSAAGCRAPTVAFFGRRMVASLGCRQPTTGRKDRRWSQQAQMTSGRPTSGVPLHGRPVTPRALDAPLNRWGRQLARKHAVQRVRRSVRPGFHRHIQRVGSGERR